MARKRNFDEKQVLENAIELFWRKGYNATSIQDLVDELGINRASLYNTWGDKHKLYLSALQLYRQNASFYLLEEIRSEKPAFEVIESFLQFIIQQAINDKLKKGCFIVNSITEMANQDEEVFQLAAENRFTLEKVLTELIKEGQATGDFTTAKPADSLARFIFISISGLRVVSKSDVTEKELKDVVRIILDALK